jgi:putative SOS response-associated peptidase YedK
MCTRYTLTNMQALAEFCEDLGVALDPEKFTPRYNVALTQRMPVIVSRGQPALAEMAFGLTLPPRPPEKRGLLVANARAETIRHRPAFREAVDLRRCLVPADGFYEFAKDGKARLPHHFYLKDHRPFFFAGLWQPETEATPAAFVIVTTEPNDVVRPVHDRMPVILGPNSGPEWLGSAPLDPALLTRLCRPLPADLMAGHRVDSRVNNVRYEAPDAVAPLPAHPEPLI